MGHPDPRAVFALLLACLPTACAGSGHDLAGIELLDQRPPPSQIRFHAGSWEELRKLSQPSATLGHSLLLWCSPDGDAHWTFDVAQTFALDSETRREWMILDGPEQWINSEFEGTFVSARGISARRLGTAPDGGDLFKLSCAHVPGGVKGNTAVLVLLVSRSPAGDWRILWRGDEAPFWSMGNFCIGRRLGFSVVAGSIRIDERLDLSPSFEDDRETHPELGLHRRGLLTGSPPMTVSWTSPWRHRVQRPQTWEDLARTMALYGMRQPAGDLRRANPFLESDRLEPGTDVDLAQSVNVSATQKR